MRRCVWLVVGTSFGYVKLTEAAIIACACTWPTEGAAVGDDPPPVGEGVGEAAERTSQAVVSGTCGGGWGSTIKGVVRQASDLRQ